MDFSNAFSKQRPYIEFILMYREGKLGSFASPLIEGKLNASKSVHS